MQIYADTASLAEVERLNEHPLVSGFTTNPTIFRNANVSDPLTHAKELLSLTSKPVSLDGPPTLVWELGPNAIPKVTKDGIYEKRVNYTAICSKTGVPTLAGDEDIISIFAGRILDTGVDPTPIITKAKRTGARILWASTRELYHLHMAKMAGCDIITMSTELIDKMDSWWGRPLTDVHKLTLEQFDLDRIPWI